MSSAPTPPGHDGQQPERRNTHRDTTGRLPSGLFGPRSTEGLRQRFWWPLLAILVAAGMYALLPASLRILPRFTVPGLELLLGVFVLVTRRHGGRRPRITRWAAITDAFLVIAANLVALGHLVALLSSQESGSSMLVGAMEVWFTNVIGFALLFWEIDRGGPLVRHTEPRWRLPLADFRFSQDEDRDTVLEVSHGASERGWMPEFVDYFYMSLTCSSAFSPTDTMPLSARAKMLMGLEATAALLISLLIVARAVGSLTG